MGVAVAEKGVGRMGNADGAAKLNDGNIPTHNNTLTKPPTPTKKSNLSLLNNVFIIPP
jgi:hypothetical protein